VVEQGVKPLLVAIIIIGLVMVGALIFLYNAGGGGHEATTTASSISSLDGPIIHSFEIKKLPPKGVAEVIVNASDTSGIAKALIGLNGKNASMIRLANGLYAYNVSMGEDPATLPIKVYVLDPYRQSASAAGETHWLLLDAFTYYGVKHGFSEAVTQNFYKQYKELVERFYPTNKSEILAPLHVYDINATLLSLAKQKVYNDSHVPGKAKILWSFPKLCTIWEKRA